jgi:hypothetical protein
VRISDDKSEPTLVILARFWHFALKA